MSALPDLPISSYLPVLALTLNPEVARSTVVELLRVKPDTDHGGDGELSFRVGERAVSSGSRCYQVPPFCGKSLCSYVQSTKRCLT